jgi:hypothetical protein
MDKEFRTEVLMFADRGLMFELNECEDASSIGGHLATLSTAGHALTRIIDSLDGGAEIEEEELPSRILEARSAIAFVLSMSSILANTLRRLERGGAANTRGE